MRAMLRCPAGKALIVKGIARRHPLGVLGGLVPVQLGAPQPDAVDDVHHACLCLVAKHPHRQDLGWDPLDDASHRLRRDLARRRGEDESDGVGSQAHGQEGIGLRRDPADLHEHGLTSPVPPPGGFGTRRGAR